MEDKFLWLEEVEGLDSLSWVEQQNKISLEHFKASDIFSSAYDKTLSILQNPKKITLPVVINGEIHNLWTDEQHLRGLWRKCSLASYLAKTPEWQTVLDMDLLAQVEIKNWVLKSLQYHVVLSPNKQRMMVALSDGGKDATVWREFCLETNSFLTDGFSSWEAKSYVEWLDDDTLLISTKFGEDSVTASGYARTVRTWKRGDKLEQAETVFTIDKSHMHADAHDIGRGKDRAILFVDTKDFFNSKHSLYIDGVLYSIDLPDGTFCKGKTGDQITFYTAKDIEVSGHQIKSGSLFSISFSEVIQGKIVNIHPMFTPSSVEFIDQHGQHAIDNGFIVSGMNNIAGIAYRYEWNKESWIQSAIELPATGSVNILTADGKDIFINYEDFLTPQSLYYYNSESSKLGIIDTLSPYFDSEKYKVKQCHATSSDGMRIPYFLISGKNIKYDGMNPTIVNGYGGFNISKVPAYLRTMGPLWLDQGGVYVVANIRGGGEFGPAWHQAALKENRQLAFDDFIAVNEDLISSAVTSPDHLGIIGGSNGGLLTSAVLTQRPELFNAVCIAVPLIDMLRFHKLLAGHSWIAEYGNPDIAEEREYIAKYSPYQNVGKDKKYPKVFLMTSTKDDRVHPGHARKMAAKMLDMGHELYYYENIEGGHGGSANSLQRAQWVALEMSYFRERLFKIS